MKYLRVIHIKVRVEIVLVDDITVVERKEGLRWKPGRAEVELC